MVTPSRSTAAGPTVWGYSMPPGQDGEIGHDEEDQRTGHGRRRHHRGGAAMPDHPPEGRRDQAAGVDGPLTGVEAQEPCSRPGRSPPAAGRSAAAPPAGPGSPPGGSGRSPRRRAWAASGATLGGCSRSRLVAAVTIRAVRQQKRVWFIPSSPWSGLGPLRPGVPVAWGKRLGGGPPYWAPLYGEEVSAADPRSIPRRARLPPPAACRLPHRRVALAADAAHRP